MRARLSLDQRGIWHDDELLAHVEIGIGTYIALNPGTLRIENALQLVADARETDGKPEGRASRERASQTPYSLQLGLIFRSDRDGFVFMFRL